MRVLVVNAGSTSMKLRLVAADDAVVDVSALDDADPAAVDVVAHRIVHGGTRFTSPVLLDDEVVAQLTTLIPLAPLHLPPALAAIGAARRRLDAVPHVAVFDTAFHATIGPAASTYAVPLEWREGFGVRRYGFHGLSVEWCTARAAVLLGRPADDLGLVVCHLGGGCSVTALRGGSSVDTTMGMTPLDGVPMATRSGAVDPGAIVYLLEHGVEVDELGDALEHRSGLVGLGGSGDMRELERRLAAGDADAALALDVFCHRVAGAVGAMAVAAGRLDALVFTAGIGEGSALVRSAVCARLAVLGVAVDEALNRVGVGERDVAQAGAPVRVLVVPTHEERVAARQARGLLAAGA